MTSIAAARDMPAPEERVHVSAYHKSLLQSPVFLGMVMFIGSEIMLFGSFFTAYFYVRFSHGQYPFGGFEIPKGTTGINTAILVASSFTMHWALVSASRGRRLGLIAGLRACRGKYAPDDHLGLEVTGLYWHFVDVVWIFLYTVVYLL
jgi:heme/copper-type cytochrome/quinol oxidase subunit 3